MGLLDFFRKKDKEDINTLSLDKVENLLKESPLETIEEKMGMQIMIMNEAKREKQVIMITAFKQISELIKLAEQYLTVQNRIKESVFEDKQELALLRRQVKELRSAVVEKIYQVQSLIVSIAWIYGRGGDNPRFLKAISHYVRVLQRTLKYPSLLPQLIYASQIILAMAQYDKDVAVNTPIILRKMTPEFPTDVLTSMLGGNTNSNQPSINSLPTKEVEE